MFKPRTMLALLPACLLGNLLLAGLFPGGLFPGGLFLGDLFLSGGAAMAQTGDETVTLHGHQGAVFQAAFTPDDRLVITVSADHAVRCWNASNGQALRVLNAHAGPVFCLAISGNGSRLATGGEDNTVRLWDVPRETPLISLQAHHGPLAAMARSPDGRWLATADAEGSLRLWDLGQQAADTATAESLTAASRLLTDAMGSIAAAAFSPDNRLLAAGDDRGLVRFWNPLLADALGEVQLEAGVRGLLAVSPQQWIALDANGRLHEVRWAPAGEPPTDALAALPALEFSPRLLAAWNGGQCLAAGDAGARLIDAATGKSSGPLLAPADSVRCVAVRGDRQRLAVGVAQAVWIYAAGADEPLQRLAVEGQPLAACYSDNRQVLAVATDQGRLHFFGPPPAGGETAEELQPHQTLALDAAPSGLAFDFNASSVWVTDRQGRLQRWAYAAPTPLRQFNHSGAVYSVALNRAGSLVVSCGADQTIRIWDAETGQQKSQLRGHVGAVHAVALTDDEALVVSSGADHALRLWDAATGRQLKQLATLDETMYSIAVHPMGRRLAAAGADRRIHLLDLPGGESRQVLEGHADYIHAVQYSRDGRLLLSYSYAGDLRIWDAESGDLLWRQQVGRIGNGASFSFDSRRVLVANGDAAARILALPPSLFAAPGGGPVP